MFGGAMQTWLLSESGVLNAPEEVACSVSGPKTNLRSRNDFFEKDF